MIKSEIELGLLFMVSDLKISKDLLKGNLVIEQKPNAGCINVVCSVKLTAPGVQWWQYKNMRKVSKYNVCIFQVPSMMTINYLHFRFVAI